MSKKISLCLILLLSMLFSSFWFVNSEIKNDWLCIPGKRVGPITSNSSEKQLIEYFGKKNVRREQIVVGEGEGFESATFIFKDTRNEIVVKWKDDKTFSKPASISIYKEGSKWKTPEGITIGISLNELNEINGKGFYITGFGWEFGGYISSWNKGKLSKYKDKTLAIRVDEKNKVRLPANFYGDGKNFSSKEKVLIKADVRVDLIRMTF